MSVEIPTELLNNSTTLSTLRPKQVGDPCEHCRKRPSTMQWIGEGGWLAQSHGFYEMWCDFCATEAQLEYAQRMSANIPELEAKMATLR